MMTTTAGQLVFEKFAWVALRQSNRANHSKKLPLRIAILPDEQFCLPHSAPWRLGVLAGRAWVSYAGRDFYPAAGESLFIPKDRYGAIVSAVGKEALLFELN